MCGAIDAKSTQEGDQSFHFVNYQTGGAVTNSITWLQNANASGTGDDVTVVQGDTDGILTTVELQITLTGLINLNDTSFLL